MKTTTKKTQTAKTQVRAADFICAECGEYLDGPAMGYWTEEDVRRNKSATCYACGTVNRLSWRWR